MLGSWLRSRAGENIRASTKEVYAYKEVTGKNEAAAGGMAATKQKLTLYLSVSFSFSDANSEGRISDDRRFT